MKVKTLSIIFDKIIKSLIFSKLSGVVIGDPDLVGSFNLKKDKDDSPYFYNLLERNIKKIKNSKIIKVGGSVTPKSKKFMDSLFKSKLINSTETRNIEFKINKYSLTKL